MHNQRIKLGFLLMGFNTFSCDASYQRCIILIGNPLGHDITDTDQQFNIHMICHITMHFAFINILL